jgi:hypothetical protein
MSTNRDEEYKKTIKDAEKKVSEPRVIRPSSQMLRPTIRVGITLYSKKTLICPDCGNIGKTISITKESFLIEIIIWLMFLIPRVLYSVWGLSTRIKGCSLCGSQHMIPVFPPRGQTSLTEFQRR